jgi:hypothetical protein
MWTATISTDAWFVVTCLRNELLETVIGGQDRGADVEVVGDES